MGRGVGGEGGDGGRKVGMGFRNIPKYVMLRLLEDVFSLLEQFQYLDPTSKT